MLLLFWNVWLICGLFECFCSRCLCCFRMYFSFLDCVAIVVDCVAVYLDSLAVFVAFVAVLMVCVAVV